MGGGVFGLTSAIELSNNGYLVDVKEKSAVEYNEIDIVYFL